MKNNQKQAKYWNEKLLMINNSPGAILLKIEKQLFIQLMLTKVSEAERLLYGKRFQFVVLVLNIKL